MSSVNNLSFLSHLHWALPKGEIKILILSKKASEFITFGLNTFLDEVQIPKPQKLCWLYGHLKRKVKCDEQKQWKMVSSSSQVNHYIIIFTRATGDKAGLADEHLRTFAPIATAHL